MWPLPARSGWHGAIRCRLGQRRGDREANRSGANPRVEGAKDRESFSWWRRRAKPSRRTEASEGKESQRVATDTTKKPE